jgi:hypothetical protein
MQRNPDKRQVVYVRIQMSHHSCILSGILCSACKAIDSHNLSSVNDSQILTHLNSNKIKIVFDPKQARDRLHHLNLLQLKVKLKTRDKDAQYEETTDGQRNLSHGDHVEIMSNPKVQTPPRAQ